VPSRPELQECYTLHSVDLQADPEFEIYCDRCPRRIGFYGVMDDGLEYPLVAVYELTRLSPTDRLSPPNRYGDAIAAIRTTGRQRGRWVAGRETASRDRVRSAQEQGRGPLLDFRVECGCGHIRTIGLAALRRKLEQASEPRIRL
jgi:hypothetical protein